MAHRFLLALLALTFSVTAHAQMYKWVDADGKVTYSDTPPPKTVKQVETKSLSSSDSVSTSALPFDLAKAVKSMPVTIYTSTNCQACDNGKDFLKQNGIPFSERTVTTNADVEKLISLNGGSSQLPFLQIGRTKLTGFNSGNWRSNLTLAGYPESNMLPADYQYPAPQPTVPAVTTQKPADTTKTPTQSEQPVRDPNGFQF